MAPPTPIVRPSPLIPGPKAATAPSAPASQTKAPPSNPSTQTDPTLDTESESESRSEFKPFKNCKELNDLLRKNQGVILDPITLLPTLKNFRKKYPGNLTAQSAQNIKALIEKGVESTDLEDGMAAFLKITEPKLLQIALDKSIKYMTEAATWGNKPLKDLDCTEEEFKQTTLRGRRCRLARGWTKGDYGFRFRVLQNNKGQFEMLFHRDDYDRVTIPDGCSVAFSDVIKLNRVKD